jgi:dolichol-phosphate mannosyltransferase
MACELTVILPSYLEEENLRLLLPRIKEHCQNISPNYEILVVDTMTPMDGTPDVCKDLGIKYLNRKNGNMYGDAVRTGIQVSQGKYIIFMDADGSHAPHFLEELYKCHNDAEVVIASRYIDGGFTENSQVLVLMSLIVNIGYRLILGLRCKDVSNSFKLYPGEALRKLQLNCNNFDIVEEILFKIVRLNPQFRLKEIPFSFKKRMFGETKRNLFAFIFTYLITLIRLRFSL